MMSINVSLKRWTCGETEDGENAEALIVISLCIAMAAWMSFRVENWIAADIIYRNRIAILPSYMMLELEIWR
jgi:hypothetical protein